MKKVIAVLCLFVFVIGFVTVHAMRIHELSRDVQEITDEIEEAFLLRDWERIKSGLKTTDDRWKKSKIWASLTIDTDVIEEIEISLEQSRRYAELEDGEDFVGEFVMFKMLVSHLPHREGISLEELL